ncbi:hypothetical protein M440DRAFT_1406043 [Trichoderma longibrachiatum ATCC 18648]|uniref:Uncharacterized protein n=1 Tax=Trichoderma longibrachiatum ATCC 18648 TaxID=983965 RepID=A0A2T4BRT1_TRILO|nr:hypothetical protein M440DRAFT_1406043 [Trichoderma longibrachiatum ATCC 18648]
MGRISELKGAERLFDILLFLSALLLFHCISALDVFPVNRLFRLTLVSTCLFLTKSERQAESETGADCRPVSPNGCYKGCRKMEILSSDGRSGFRLPQR